MGVGEICEAFSRQQEIFAQRKASQVIRENIQLVYQRGRSDTSFHRRGRGYRAVGVCPDTGGSQLFYSLTDMEEAPAIPVYSQDGVFREPQV